MPNCIAYKNLQQFIQLLNLEGEFMQMEASVNPHVEIAEITDRVSKTPGNGMALLLKNTGYDLPVSMNAY